MIVQNQLIKRHNKYKDFKTTVRRLINYLIQKDQTIIMGETDVIKKYVIKKELQSYFKKLFPI